MTTVSYAYTSPYYATKITNGYLESLNYRAFSMLDSDRLYEVNAKYQNRPDLLANDLYGDVRLWWVFAVRNKSVIKDPVFDLVAGIKIYLPQITTLKKDLGI